jgi:hypothetical protein
MKRTINCYQFFKLFFARSLDVASATLIKISSHLLKTFSIKSVLVTFLQMKLIFKLSNEKDWQRPCKEFENM